MCFPNPVCPLESMKIDSCDVLVAITATPDLREFVFRSTVVRDALCDRSIGSDEVRFSLTQIRQMPVVATFTWNDDRRWYGMAIDGDVDDIVSMIRAWPRSDVSVARPACDTSTGWEAAFKKATTVEAIVE